MDKMEKLNTVGNIANMKHSKLIIEKKPRKYRKTTVERIGINRFYNDWVNKNKYALLDPKGKIIEKFRIQATAHHRMKELQNFKGELKIVELDWDGKIVVPNKRV